MEVLQIPPIQIIKPIFLSFLTLELLLIASWNNLHNSIPNFLSHIKK